MRAPRLLAALVLTAAGASVASTATAERGHEEPDVRWLTDLRVRYGLATVDVLATETSAPVATRTDSVTLLLSAGYEFDERFGVTVFLPFVMGALTPEGGARASAPPAFGNTGIEASFRFRPSATVVLEPRALLALPTARGDEFGAPDEAARFQLLRGAGYSQGSQEMVLFEAGRMGGEVGLLVAWTPGRFALKGWLKIEAMFDVRGDLREPTIVESVGGVVAGYALGLGFHAGLGFTYNRPWTSHEPKRFEAGTLDPYVEWRKGLGRLGLVAVLPIFGNATVQRTFGLSLVGTLRF